MLFVLSQFVHFVLALASSPAMSSALRVLLAVSAAAAVVTAAAVADAVDPHFVPRSTRPRPSPSGLLAAATLPPWTAVPGGPGTGCSHGTEWSFMVRLGRPDRLVVELEGGGCCFDDETCQMPIYTHDVDVQATLSMLRDRGGIGGAHVDNPVLNWTHLVSFVVWRWFFFRGCDAKCW